jgi:hypothetical protein
MPNVQTWRWWPRSRQLPGLRVLSLVAGSLLVSQAVAQEVPKPLGITLEGVEHGELASPSDTDLWSVRLAAGQIVGFGMSGMNGRAELLDPSRAVIRSFSTQAGNDAGTEYKARMDGNYYLRVRMNGDQTGTLPYSIWARPDCLARKASTCSVKQGKREKRTFAWNGDKDWLRINPVAGRFYRFCVSIDPLSSGPIPGIELRDSDGNIAKEGLSIDDGPAWGYCIFYKVRKSDRYYPEFAVDRHIWAGCGGQPY